MGMQQEHLINVNYLCQVLLLIAIGSKFGSILDMVTDRYSSFLIRFNTSRASTSCLIVVLANFYPKYTLHFQFLIAIDIISHFAHIFSSLSRGATSHKIISKEQNIFLRIYYTNRLVLGKTTLFDSFSHLVLRLFMWRK